MTSPVFWTKITGETEFLNLPWKIVTSFMDGPLDAIFISNIPPFVVKNVTKLLQKMFTKNIWKQCMLTKLIGNISATNAPTLLMPWSIFMITKVWHITMKRNRCVKLAVKNFHPRLVCKGYFIKYSSTFGGMSMVEIS